MSLFTATMLNINVIIGAGILLNPPIMAGLAGNVSFLGWILCGIIFFPLVWGAAEASKLWAGQAGFYTFGKKGLNEGAGFVAGWTYFIAYLGTPVGHLLGLRAVLATQFHWRFVVEHPLLFNAFYVVVLSLLTFLSIKVVSAIQNSSTIIKLIPLLTVIFLFVFYFNPNFILDFQCIPVLGATLPLTVFAFLGFEVGCNVSHLVEGGQKNAARALFYGFYIVLALYTLFHFGLLQIMGAENLATFGGAAFPQFLGIKSVAIVALLKALIAATFVVTYVSASYGIFIGNSTLLRGMAEEKVFPGSAFIAQHNRNDRPWVAICCQALGVFILSVMIQDMSAMSFVVLFVLPAMIIMFIALLKSNNQTIARQLFSLAGLISCCILGYFSWIGLGSTMDIRITNLTPGILIFAFGLAMYILQKRITKKA